MMRGPTTAAFWSGTVIAAGIFWFSAPLSSRPATVSELVPGVAYAVEVTGEQTTLDLEFQPGTRYTLVVSSLGDASQVHHVSLRAVPVVGDQSFPVSRIPSLRPPHFEWIDTIPRPERTHRARGESVSSRKPQDGESSSRDFFLYVTDGDLNDPHQYVRVTGRLVAEGRRTRIFLDSRQTTRELANGLIGEIGTLLDEQIIESLENDLGELRDVDDDGRFTVLLTPWLSKLQGGTTSLGGFVRGSDFQNDVEPPLGNQCDMIYLNSNLRPDAHLKTLLAHEMTHAICFSQRLPSSRNHYGLPEEDDWLNEAIAHLAENRRSDNWSNLNYRVSRFLNAPQDCPLVVDDYYRAGLWRDHGCRGATYLFLRWCADQYGDELLRRLIRAPMRGTRNLEWATGTKFEELFRRWSLALLLNNHQPPTAAANRGDRSARTRIGTRDGELHSIDLWGPLGDWNLAGPRSLEWDIDQGSHEVRLKGTTTAFLVVESSGKPGVKRIRLQAEHGTQLQVSVVRQPMHLPHVQMQAEWTHSPTGAEPETAVALAHHRLSVRVSIETEPVLQIESLSWERNFSETRETRRFFGDGLRAQLENSTGHSDERTGSVYVLPIPVGKTDASELIIKAIVRDAAGRKSAAWATVTSSQKPTVASQRLAAASKRRHASRAP